MKFNEYIQLAMRTNLKGRSFKDNILNGLLGLQGELIELELAESLEEQIDELSDLYWYTALMYQTMDCKIETIANYKSPSIIIGGLADHFKKHFFQGHDLDKEFVCSELNKLKFFIDYFAVIFCNVSPEEIMKHNIEKLQKRFPNGFSKNDSINRTI